MSSPRSPGENPTRDAVAAAMERSLSNIIPMKECVTSFGSNASRAKTDVTTSTVMTAQIGNRESPKKSPTFGRSPTAGQSQTMARGGGGDEFSFGESQVAVRSRAVMESVQATMSTFLLQRQHVKKKRTNKSYTTTHCTPMSSLPTGEHVGTSKRYRNGNVPMLAHRRGTGMAMEARSS